MLICHWLNVLLVLIPGQEVNEEAVDQQQAGPMAVEQDQQEDVEAQDVGEPGIIGELMNPINCYGY